MEWATIFVAASDIRNSRIQEGKGVCRIIIIDMGLAGGIRGLRLGIARRPWGRWPIFILYNVNIAFFYSFEAYRSLQSTVYTPMNNCLAHSII